MNFNTCGVLLMLRLCTAALEGELSTNILFEYMKKTKFPQKNTLLKSVMQDLVIVLVMHAVSMDVMEEMAMMEHLVLEGLQAEMDEMVVMECLVLEVLLAEMARLDHRE